MFHSSCPPIGVCTFERLVRVPTTPSSPLLCPRVPHSVHLYVCHAGLVDPMHLHSFCCPCVTPIWAHMPHCFLYSFVYLQTFRATRTRRSLLFFDMFMSPCLSSSFPYSIKPLLAQHVCTQTLLLLSLALDGLQRFRVSDLQPPLQSHRNGVKRSGQYVPRNQSF